MSRFVKVYAVTAVQRPDWQRGEIAKFFTRDDAEAHAAYVQPLWNPQIEERIELDEAQHAAHEGAYDVVTSD